MIRVCLPALVLLATQVQMAIHIKQVRLNTQQSLHSLQSVSQETAGLIPEAWQRTPMKPLFCTARGNVSGDGESPAGRGWQGACCLQVRTEVHIRSPQFRVVTADSSEANQHMARPSPVQGLHVSADALPK